MEKIKLKCSTNHILNGLKVPTVYKQCDIGESDVLL